MIQLLLHLKLHSTVHVVTYWEMTHPLVCKVIVLTATCSSELLLLRRSHCQLGGLILP